MFIGCERERERLIYLELIKICLSTENFNIRYHARPSPTTEEEIDDVKKKNWSSSAVHLTGRAPVFVR